MSLEILQILVVVQGVVPYGVVLLGGGMYDSCILVSETREIDPILFRIQRFQVSVCHSGQRWTATELTTRMTCLPVLQLYNRKVSSSDAVRTWSPLSSKVIAVICRGPAFTLELPPGVGGGVGSTAPLKILAGLNLVCKPSRIRRVKITDGDKTHH